MAAPNNEPLRAYLVVQRKADTELKKRLERAARDARTQIRKLPAGGGSNVRRAQLNRVIAAIRKIQMDLWTDGVPGVVMSGRADAIEAAEKVADDLTAVLYVTLPERVANAVAAGLNASSREGIEADKARIPRTLSKRVLKNGKRTSANIEKTIQSGLARNLSAEEMAKEVYRYISPTTPGGASYAAMRLARTEINNAYHERQIANGQRPGVTGIIWNLSGSHKVPDECNVFAKKNGGVFKVNQVPGKPHPHCFCFLTYKMVPPAKFEEFLNNGEFDSELDRRLKEMLG